MRCLINSQDAVHESLDGEVVIVNLKTGRYYSLIDSASEIWQMIEDGETSQQIEARLSAKYRFDESPGPVLVGFLQQLQSEGLICLEADGPDQAAAELTPAAADAPLFQPPELTMHSDMEGLLLLDPIHEVSEQGWPEKKAAHH